MKDFETGKLYVFSDGKQRKFLEVDGVRFISKLTIHPGEGCLCLEISDGFTRIATMLSNNGERFYVMQSQRKFFTDVE